MKKLCLPFFLISVLSVQNSAFAGSAPVQHARYSFMVDLRPVDGPFQKLDIVLNAEGSYDASIHTVTAGDGFPVQDTVEVLGTGLDCQEVKKGKKLLTLTCSVDNRPADGLLEEVIVKRNEDKLYDVTLHKAAYGTLQSPEYDETTEISYGMTRQN